jgi:hypothetical protein
MADASNQMTPSNQMAPGGATNPATPHGAMERASRALARRPGLVTFAALMMFLLAGFQFTWAVVEFANAAWLTNVTYGTFGGYLWLWGLLDIGFALLAFYAGYSVLAGGRFGQIFGLVVAGISAVRWFFYLPAAPVVGIVMIAVNVLIIYALVAHADYFTVKARA